MVRTHPPNKMPQSNEANWFTDEDELVQLTPEEKETPEGSQPEQTKTEEEKPDNGTPAEENKETEEQIPFHKHPRFKALIEDNKTLKAQLEENSRMMQELSERSKQEPQLQSIPEWFVKLYGDDPQVWETYQAQRQFELKELEDNLLSRIEPKLKDIEAEQREKQASQEIDQQLKELEDEGLKFDRNALMKVVYDNQLFDMQGKFNFKAGLAMLQVNKPDNSKVEARKQVAAKTNATEAGGDAPKKEYYTSADVAGKDWRSFFNKL